ncbi:MAG: DUF5016 domain-containing protein [Alistipes shahii]
MKTLKYIALSLLVAASTTACKDDPELLTTDVGPEMTVVSADASGVYGGKVDFEVTMTDRYALSTLKAQVFFDDEMVAEEVIRTKSDGTYTGAVTLPFTRTFPTARPRCASWGRTCASERRPSTGRSPYRVPSPPT